MSAIMDIYLCNHKHSEEIKMPQEYWELDKKMSEIFHELEKLIGSEKKELLSELFDAAAGCECAQAETNYLEGFKLGMKLAMEVLS